MKFEEKKKLDKKGVADLFRGIGDLIEKGELEIQGKRIIVGDATESEIKYKEKKGRAELEIEVKWSIHGEEMMEGKVEGETDLKSVKKSLKKSFNSLRADVEEEKLPKAVDASSFIKLSKKFQSLSKNTDFGAGTNAYMNLVESLSGSLGKGDLDALKNDIERLRSAKKSCHKTYRWKEG